MMTELQEKPRVSRWTNWLASVCANCPLCKAIRKGRNDLLARVYKRLAWLCPFCRAYERKKRLESETP